MYGKTHGTYIKLKDHQKETLGSQLGTNEYSKYKNNT